jgi:hypothetical protein
MELQRLVGAVRSNPAVAVLVAVLIGVDAVSLQRLLAGYPAGVDLEIPLHAAERWLAGGEPYPPEAFKVDVGPGLPFLYPPFVLPIVAPLTNLPRGLPLVVWTLILVAGGRLAGMRLGLSPRVAAVALLWPPFFEGILGGNVQILLFAGFAVLLYRDGQQLDPADEERTAAVDGVLGAFVGALKISQVHAWVYVLRRRPPAAVVGLAVIVGLALMTLPLVGIDAWTHWISQAGRSGDPTWPPIGAPLSIFVGQPVALVVSALSVAAVFVVPRRQAGAWIGILMLVGAPSLHMFGLLFLLPAMVSIRREVALAAAILIATYVSQAIWIAILGVGWTLMASARWPRLRARPGSSLPAPISHGLEATRAEWSQRVSRPG